VLLRLKYPAAKATIAVIADATSALSSTPNCPASQMSTIATEPPMPAAATFDVGADVGWSYVWFMFTSLFQSWYVFTDELPEPAQERFACFFIDPLSFLEPLVGFDHSVSFCFGGICALG